MTVSRGIRPRRARVWPAPAALIVLSLVPVIAGAVRVTELLFGAEVTPENARFFDSPVPIVLHIVGATVFCVVGAFQFPTGIRRRRLGWHRAAGRVLVLCGLVAALSGLWMTGFYPHPPKDGPLLTVFRYVFGTAMVVSIVAGVVAVRRRDIRAHRAWMLRGYAIGMGAGTQVLTLGPWTVVFGEDQLSRALLSLAGWAINLVIAEGLIRRRPM